MGKIVVGTDGSKGSAPALRWAAGEARLRGVPLEIVNVWQLPAAAQLYVNVDAELEAGAHAIVDGARTMLVEELGDKVPELHLTVSHGSTAPALIDAAADADLLVVGSHGHGAFTGLLLGSVGLHCASHAPCPVVIVRE